MDNLRKELLDGAASGQFVEHPLPPIIMDRDADMVDGGIRCVSRYNCACAAGDAVMFPDGTKGEIVGVDGSTLTIRTAGGVDPKAMSADCILANLTHYREGLHREQKRTAT